MRYVVAAYQLWRSVNDLNMDAVAGRFGLLPAAAVPAIYRLLLVHRMRPPRAAPAAACLAAARCCPAALPYAALRVYTGVL
jgi:hypothetical protein